MTACAASIMIVDDEPRNLDVLVGMLQREGHRILAFTRADMALQVLAESVPDVILLDVRMPGMDGFEFCRIVKSDHRVRDVPVMFLTACGDHGERMRGFELGAVDYIVKPLHEAEVLARVRTHLELRRHRLHLEELLHERSAQLLEAHRRLRIWDEAKTEWLNVLAHEMRTPLTGILGVSDLALEALSDTAAFARLRPAYDASRLRIMQLISDATFLVDMEVEKGDFVLAPCAVETAMQTAIHKARATAASGVDMAAPIVQPPGLAVTAEEALLQRILESLLFAACQCVSPGGCIRTNAAATGDGTVTIRISTDGEALPEADLQTFFDVGGQRTLLTAGGDFGLRPVLARRIVALLNGSVGVANGDTQGIVLSIVLREHNRNTSEVA